MRRKVAKLAYYARKKISFDFELVVVMGLLQRVGVAVVRPVYRAFFERPLWWFLTKVKVFFFAETSERLLRIENRLAATEKIEKPVNFDELFRRTEATNAAQWDALEQLLLAILHQPASRTAESSSEIRIPQQNATSNATEQDRVNGPITLR